MDAAGDLFIADMANNRIRKVNHATGRITTIAGTGVAGYNGDGIPAASAELEWPQGVAVDAAGDVFIADQGNNRVREVNAVTGRITTLVGPEVNGGRPTSVAVDAASDVFITYQASNLVSKWTARTGQVTTVAGNGVAGFNGDNIPGTAAELNQPGGLAVDRTGNVFIADQINDSIREVHASTGLISTVPGTGRTSYQLANIPAAAALLDHPSSVAVDASGNLFIADDQASLIQEVNRASGLLTTIAGGGDADPFTNATLPATSIALALPTGVAVDAAGDVFINDLGSNRIQEVNHASGLLTTVVGGLLFGYNGDNIPATSAELDGDAAIAVDAAGDLFLSDLGNNRIREVNAATGLITTVAGIGVAGFNGDNIAATSAELNDPGALAVDAAGDLFFTDWNNNRVREVNHATGRITTVAGNGKAGYAGDNGLAVSAELNRPAAVAAGAAGNLFIADYGNNRVREVNHATGVITTVAGNGVAGYNGSNIAATAVELNQPDGLAVDAAGDLFINDSGNRRILEMAAAHAPDHLVVIAGASSTAGKTVSFTVEALDANNHVDPNFTGKVHISSSDARATLPADAALVGGIGAFSAILRTAGNQSLAASSPAGPTGGSATVQVTPAAISQFLLSVPAASAGAGVFATATAEDAFGNVAAGYTGTAVLTSSDPGAMLQPTLTFTKAGAGVAWFGISFYTAGIQTVSLSDKTAHVTGSATVSVQAGAASALLVSGPATVTAGKPAVYTVTAVNAFGNVVTGYLGTVVWDSTDPDATLPPAYTFTAADKGSHRFVITFAKKAKNVAIGAGDASNPAALNGRETGIGVT